MPALKNAKHEAVVQAYIADRERVGWRAYSKAYPKSSRPAAEVGFSRLLKNAKFAARIAELDGAVASGVVQAAIMDLAEVLSELSKLGRTNMKRFVGLGGADSAEVIASLRELPDEDAAAIQELTVETYTEGGGEDARQVKRVKLKLHDKRGPLSELRRHYEPTAAARPPQRAEDFVPLAERIEAYRRAAAIKGSAGKVVELANKGARKRLPSR